MQADQACRPWSTVSRPPNSTLRLSAHRLVDHARHVEQLHPRRREQRKDVRVNFRFGQRSVLEPDAMPGGPSSRYSGNPERFDDAAALTIGHRYPNLENLNFQEFQDGDANSGRC
jgi:hypothetical protein